MQLNSHNLSANPAASILAVDDDPMAVTVMRRIVERLGHRCVTAESGEAALVEMESTHFDLLITDVKMGAISGLELLESARRTAPDLAVIVVSGLDDPLTAEAALAGGAFGYVVKPFELTELHIAVSNALRRRELEITLRNHLLELESEVERRTDEARRATDVMRVREQRFRSLAQASPLGILYADTDGLFEYCNDNAADLLGRSIEDLQRRRWLTDMVSNDLAVLEDSIAATTAGGDGSACEYELIRPDGTGVWTRSSVASVLDDAGAATGIVVLFEDVTERKRLEEQLRLWANHDPLTGLFNRREFYGRLDVDIARADGTRTLGLLLIDLDEFKLVNDTYGHEAGDQLIVTVAQRLVATAPEGSTIARLGGDEYVVSTFGTPDEILALAELIRLALREPIRLSGVDANMTASVGVVVTSDSDTPARDLLRRADMALHHSKTRRDSVEMFDAAIERDTSRRLTLASELRRAIDHRDLTVEYQPIFDASTKRLVGLEALARWTHRELGPIGPDEFIPIAETAGLVHEIDRQVFDIAIDQYRRWRESGQIDQDVFISVNLSASQVVNGALPVDVRTVLDRAGIDGSSVCFEVTEGHLVADLAKAIPVLEQLRCMGVRIAVDDFGTGHSALSYLSQLPLDVMKIDRSFVATLGSGGPDIVEPLIDLGHRFGLTVIAEGVEEPYQLDVLRELKCDMVQGFLTGRPAHPGCVLPVASDDYTAQRPVNNRIVALTTHHDEVRT